MVLEASDIEKRFDICFDPSEKNFITGQTIYFYCTSPFMVYCERFVSEDKKDPEPEYQKMLFEQSRLHKQCIIEKRYGKSEEIEFKSRENGFKILLESMNKAIDILCRLPAFYMPENLMGTFDILEKCSTEKSVFGDYHYVVKTITTSKKKNIEKKHKDLICKGAFYNYLLGKIQRYTPPFFYLIDRNNEELSIEYKKYRTSLRKVRTEIKKIYAGMEVTPTYNACVWSWKTYNNEKAVKTNDISLICDVGKGRKEKFVKAGINTVGDVALGTIDELAKALETGGRKRVKKFRCRAKALISNTVIPIEECNFTEKELKESKTDEIEEKIKKIKEGKGLEIFLDFEYINEQIYFCKSVKINYLIGVVTRKAGKVEYIPFIAHQMDEEREMFYQFVEWLLKQKDFTLYHWSSTEETKLKNLSDNYELSHDIKKIMKTICENMIDLRKVAENTMVFPTFGYSLKDIGNYIGYEWRQADVGANECTALYLQYIETPKKKKKLQKILDYTEDDCRATMHVKDWLKENIP
ncbi:MAG: TM0106 family RecB-like putative nuclease [Candidatus Methanofastidiosia archaeon]|jgi:uncharacterized protein